LGFLYYYIKSFVSKVFENEFIITNAGHLLTRHARESGHPDDMRLHSSTWIPAFAGMTKADYLHIGPLHALSILYHNNI
jgi:hypothetical protein